MLSLEQLLTFALASVLLTLIPGPTVLFVVGRSLSLGRRAGLWSVVGNTLGLLPVVVAVALGVGALVAESVVVFTVVKVVGAVYLVHLGVQAFRQRGTEAHLEAPTARSTLRIVRDGFVVGVTNPKSVVFLAAVLPQFVDHSAGGISGQLFGLGLVFMTVALVSDSTYAYAAGTARAWFSSSPRRLSRMQGTGGLMMIGLGGSLALTGQK
ncbi:LysE family translocator [Nocardioides sp.]|uniref:LysE family translocator n=1 Tax=Nocardioides sp. TaxID=35761 RepID=UPI001A29F27B|nr:LysE family translocator [Nocardioides sp.]MBJ7355751.1 LysE family translocator [Nocardioides sp.]